MTENIARILCVLFISSWRSGWKQHGSKCAKLKAVAENIFSRVKYHMEKKYWKIDNVVKTYRTTQFAFFYGVTGAWRCMLAHKYGTNLHCLQLGSWTFWSSIWTLKYSSQNLKLTEKGKSYQRLSEYQMEWILHLTTQACGWKDQSTQRWSDNGKGRRFMLQVYRMTEWTYRRSGFTYLHTYYYTKKERKRRSKWNL